MATTTFSAREFNQKIGEAKQRAKDGPVFVTDRGARTHVLLNIDQYEKITNGKRNLAEMLAFPALSEIDDDFEFPRVNMDLRPAELS